MPDTTKNIKKEFFSIGEVAEEFGVNTSLIRFWEKEFDIIKPLKNKRGKRMYQKRDVDNIHLIYHLVKERGFTLEGARKKLKNDKDETVKQAEVVKRLKNVRGFLVDIQSRL